MRFETRGVLAGAYRAGRERKVLLTHLCDTDAHDEAALCGKAPNLVDCGGMTTEELLARPTCPRCAARWDKVQGPDVTAASVAEVAR